MRQVAQSQTRNWKNELFVICFPPELCGLTAVYGFQVKQGDANKASPDLHPAGVLPVGKRILRPEQGLSGERQISVLFNVNVAKRRFELASVPGRSEASNRWSPVVTRRAE